MSFSSGFPPFDNAFAYVNRVKERFAERPEVFQQFLDFVREAKKPGGHEQLKQRLEGLFQGHPDLIQGVDEFMPPAPPSHL